MAQPTRTVRPPETDIVADALVLRVLPAAWRPYGRLMRLDRPIGTWLLLFPGWWSIALAASPDRFGGWPDPSLIALFGAGAVLMRGAGCVWNDITDREYDGRVARTRTRPIPAGEVSVRQALVFMAGLMALSLAILLTFNPFAIAVGAASLLLVFPYPFMKRVTYWPQVVLGLAFNWGALLGWAAVRGDLAAAPLVLYLAGIFWTLGYDTIYAHQDKEDDALLGLKSTALRLGAATRRYLWVFYAATVLLIGLSGALAGLAWPFWALLGPAAAQLAWQAARVDLDDPADCLAKFRSNRLFGWLVLAAVVAGHLAR